MLYPTHKKSIRAICFPGCSTARIEEQVHIFKKKSFILFWFIYKTYIKVFSDLAPCFWSCVIKLYIILAKINTRIVVLKKKRIVMYILIPYYAKIITKIFLMSSAIHLVLGPNSCYLNPRLLTFMNKDMLLWRSISLIKAGGMRKRKITISKYNTSFFLSIENIFNSNGELIYSLFL